MHKLIFGLAVTFAMMFGLICAVAWHTTDDESARSAIKQPAGRLVTHGEGSPIVVGEDVKVVIDGKTHYPAPQEVPSALISAETHGDRSPIVIGRGASVVINYN